MFCVNDAKDFHYVGTGVFERLHTIVEVEAIEEKDSELLRQGRVQDALNLMNKLEQMINAAQNESALIERLGVNALDLKRMRSYNPDNKG